MDLQVAKSRLEQLLRELDDSSSTLEAENARDTSELSSYDNHPADTATYLSEADREAAVLEAVEAQRREIRAALRRIEDGSYGRCVDCGQPIPDERLEVRPEAARCVRDQARVEALT